MHEIKVFVNDCEFGAMFFEGTLQGALDEASVQREYWEGEGYRNVNAQVDGKDWEDYEGVAE